MQFRGPTLIIFGLSLMLSPLAIQLAQSTTDDTPSRVQTRGQIAAACDAAGLETINRRIGCNNGDAGLAGRRAMANGGAVFVRLGS